ncbi:MAG: thiamine diphosphokinase [Actinomycetota bacterium]|nr:thiamine diphosphokinase [Actinomycetota bacterium]
MIEAHRRGLRVDLLVGDLDSVPLKEVERVTSGGGRINRYPSDKDATDLELALEAAGAEGATRVVVVGGSAGRLDHVVGNALVLAQARFASLEIDAVFGAARLHVIRGRRALRGQPGELVSLLAVGGVARGVRTKGLRWGLDGGDLHPGSTLGVSNEFVEREASVAVDEGVVLAIRPGPEAGGGAR